MRAETGYMQFGEDWRGIFIRGDNAVGYAIELQRLLAGDSQCDVKTLQDFAELLFGASELNYPEVTIQKMKDFYEAKEK